MQSCAILCNTVSSVVQSLTLASPTYSVIMCWVYSTHTLAVNCTLVIIIQGSPHGRQNRHLLLMNARWRLLSHLVSFPDPNPHAGRRVWWHLNAFLVMHTITWSSSRWHYTMHMDGIANVARIQARIPAIWLACAKTRLLTQHNQENTQLSLDPFPHERVGSGDETMSRLDRQIGTAVYSYSLLAHHIPQFT